MANRVTRVTLTTTAVLWVAAYFTATPAEWWVTFGLVFVGWCTMAVGVLAIEYADSQYRAAHYDW